MNKVILVGRFTRDPESRMSANSLEVSRFSLACQSDRANRDGERDTEFVNCVAFGATASLINRYCHKGDMAVVQGRIRNGSYEAQDGTKRYTTDVVIDNFEFGGSRRDSNQTGGNTYSIPANNNVSNYNPEPIPNAMPSTDITEDPYKNFGNEYTLSSDDLPF